jgi:hypothetical protein
MGGRGAGVSSVELCCSYCDTDVDIGFQLKHISIIEMTDYDDKRSVYY